MLLTCRVGKVSHLDCWEKKGAYWYVLVKSAQDIILRAAAMTSVGDSQN